MPKVVLVGAGSLGFSRSLISDLITFPEISDDVSLVLHDIDPTRLDVVERMARWMVRELGVATKVEAHLDRSRALDGADYVINTIAVGGMKAIETDFAIPLRYGVRQTIADTLGIGGIFRALRTIPVLTSIGNQMASLCPSAWFINYSNPMSMNPWAMYAGTPFQRVVGVCHSANSTEEYLAKLVGLPQNDITFLTAGVNHQAWVLRFEHEGRDLYPTLERIIEDDPEMKRRVRVEMYRRLGYFPTESSEHGSEYLPWFLSHDDQVAKFRIHVGAYLEWLRADTTTYAELIERLEAGSGVDIQATGQMAALMIHSLETGTRRMLHCNVRNDGLIANLPAGACVEVPCLIDRAGVQPTVVGSLPAQLAAFNRNYLNVSELTVRAALEQRRDHVYHAAMLDPNTAATLNPQQIHELVDEMIEAHRELLPDGIRN